MGRVFVKIISGWFILLLILLAGIPDATRGQEGFEEFKEQYLQEFKDFQNKYDRQFHKMLKKGWEDFKTSESPDPYDDSKFEDIPRVETPSTPAAPEPEPATEKADAGKPGGDEPQPKPEKPAPDETGADQPKKQQPEPTQPDPEPQPAEKKPEPQPEPEPTPETPSPNSALTPDFKPKVKKAKVLSSDLRFYDRPIQYKYYAAFKHDISPPINKEKVADFWKHLSTKDYGSFLDQIQQVRQDLGLNDYAYAQLLGRIGNQIYGNDTPESTLFTWFMLTQSNFGTRIGYNQSEVYLLARAKPHLFNTTYFTLDGKKYYLFSFTGGRKQTPSQLHTYKKSYPTSEQKPLDLLMPRLPVFPDAYTERTLSFSFRDTSYSFTIPVNKPYINYYDTYPNAGFDLYFGTRMTQRTHETLLKELKPLLEGKSTRQQVNLLLRFVQTAFDYKVDKEQFQREKYMFPEETLYYPASDCEDRASLFAYLVKHLVRMDYVALRYPGHLAVAVHFKSNPPEGTYYTHNNKKYYVADPTYINANVGRLMPQLEGQSPEIIDF